MAIDDKNIGLGTIGLDLRSSVNQVKKGKLTYALNAVKSGFDGQEVNYQNEPANENCINFPEGYQVIGRKSIPQKNMVAFMLVNPSTGGSEIGYVKDNNCLYIKSINADCLAFDIDKPIHKIEVKVTSTTTEIYWTDGGYMRFFDFDHLPYKEIPDTNGCGTQFTSEIDCNKLRVQPNFKIPKVKAIDVDSGGTLKAGTYQFAVQYSNAFAEAYTKYYGMTNEIPIFDPNKITLDFNYEVGKSIVLDISNLDTSGFYDYFNLAVIKTINGISTPELVGTYRIDRADKQIIYTGQGNQDIKLSMVEVLQQYPIYEKAKDLTTIQDVLVWDQVSTSRRVSYQKIWNKVHLQWQSWRLPESEGYKEETNTTNVRGYMRDEVYVLEGVFLLTNGKQTDRCVIPVRAATAYDLEIISNNDTINDEEQCCGEETQPENVPLNQDALTVAPGGNIIGDIIGDLVDDLTGDDDDEEEGESLTPCENPSLPRWKVYNTASLIDYEDAWKNSEQDNCYKGPYQYGEFGYYESSDTYPCNEEVWGDLAGKKQRFPRFPDCAISHIHDNQGNIYPLGIKIDVEQIKNLIKTSDLTEEEKNQIVGFKILRGNRVNNKSVIAKGLIHNVGKYKRDETTYFFPNYPYNDLRKDPFILKAQSGNDSGANSSASIDPFATNISKRRFTFHSADTHFFQPFLGNILKLETAEFGTSRGHFVEIKNHAKYKFLSTAAYASSLAVGLAVAVIPNGFVAGTSSGAFSPGFAEGLLVYGTLVDIIERFIPKRSFAHQYNSVGNYTDFKPVPNEGNKQRFLDIASYANPGMISVGDTKTLNNFQRESSVYLRSTKTLPFTHTINGVPEDQSRFTLSQSGNCDKFRKVVEKPISSYYASIRINIANQYGQVFSYEPIDTGYYREIDLNTNLPANQRYDSVFGGDIFINRFAYKSKFPFFIDHRVGVQDESDIDYRDVGNIGYPTYWFSTDVVEASGVGRFLQGLMGVRANNFDCRQNKFFYQDGKIYLFAYGIPYFYGESEVNVDYRQAYNSTEGDFYPRASSDIPDDWLQEINTSIQQDNTYIYNKTFSKQNKESYFSVLPEDFSEELEEALSELPLRAIMSERQGDTVHYKRNSWLIYKPSSFFDFPGNYGKLVSLEGLETRQVLARFENKSLLYNALLTANSSIGKVYFGQSLFNKDVPPIDFAETESGYMGTQHKFFLKTEYGHISIDCKRGQIFLIAGQRAFDIGGDITPFLQDNLPFNILKSFPNFPIDNHFKGVGLHGVYDTGFKRLIFTKLDYTPKSADITYQDGKFFKDGIEIFLTDSSNFCNKSFTLSFDFEDKSWISFHSYLPNYYIGDYNFFYSGVNGSISSLWHHGKNVTKFNHFFGSIHPYILEFPFAYNANDEIIQNVKDYTKVFKYNADGSFIQPNDIFFNKTMIYNNQQHSGIRNLVKKPIGKMNEQLKYPQYLSDSISILFTKSDNFYNYNTFWSLVKNQGEPIFLPSCSYLDKELNQSNMDYSKRSFKKEPIRGKDVKVRHILDNTSDYRLISQFIIAPTQPSYK